ncbi:hypothetical protein GCM10027082_04420 [Comamonas humi]
MRSTHRTATALLVACAALLAGCSSVHTVESRVQSYSTLQALPAPATYRLQMLPSQQEQAAAFAPIERQAEQSLAGVGLTRDDAAGALVMQIGAQARYIPDSWRYYNSPYAGPGWGWGLGYGRGWGGGFMMRDMGPSLHYRAVQLTMRDFKTQQVVYETSAVYEDIWADDNVIYRMLFDSALNGFPQPPQGPRTVRAATQEPAPAPAAPAPAK